MEYGMVYIVIYLKKSVLNEIEIMRKLTPHQ